MNWISENYINVLATLGAVYTAASAVAALTPTTKDDDFISKVGRFFDRIGLNLKTPKD